MKDILFKNNSETVFGAIGITEERSNYLYYRMECIIHDMFRPTPTGHIEWKDTDIIKLFIALAETDEERILLSYYAGRRSLSLQMQYDTYDEEDNDF